MQSVQIYLAGTFTFGVGKGQPHYQKLFDFERDIVDQAQHRLESYHYVGKDRKVNELRAAGAKVFLDSGAYSAFTLGQEINLEDYVNYIKQNIDLIRVEDGVLMASVLDSIGDEVKTFENQQRMETLGVRPVPTFHAGEDERYLEFYINNYEYLSLGGLVGQSAKQLEIWLDRVFNRYILDGAGHPKIRTHGFGITSVPLMERYPWYSCDSSSWIQTTAFGALTIPGYGNLDVSDESPNRHVAGHHLFTLSEIEQWTVWEMFKRQGFDPAQVRRYDGRVTYNIWAYCEIERMINENKMHVDWKRQPQVQELF